jgi:hypothetical protein
MNSYIKQEIKEEILHILNGLRFFILFCLIWGVFAVICYGIYLIIQNCI